jgi:hypothetical protein
MSESKLNESMKAVQKMLGVCESPKRHFAVGACLLLAAVIGVTMVSRALYEDYQLTYNQRTITPMNKRDRLCWMLVMGILAAVAGILLVIAGYCEK